MALCLATSLLEKKKGFDPRIRWVAIATGGK
jgi:hypothetical protein